MRTNLLKFSLILILLNLSIFNKSISENNADEIQTVIDKLPKLASGNLNNAGNEFWWSIPPCYDQVGGSGNFIRVFVISSEITNVNLEITARGYSKSLTTSPNQVASFDLNPTIAQPFVYDYTKEKNKPADVYKGLGLHVVSNKPITVFCMIRFTYTSDGWLCLPNTGLGKEYVVAAYNDYEWPGGRLPAVCTITAAYDSTKVTLTFGGTASSQVESAIDGKIYTTGQNIPIPVMNKGDVFCFMAGTSNGSTGNNDITGSKVVSTKPVSVVAGVYCAWVPVGNTACDYIGETMLPTETWGKSIPVPQVYGRRLPGVIRIFAKNDNTSIYRNGIKVGFLPKSSGNEGTGWLEMRVVPIELTPNPAMYTGDKPINIVYYNPGQTEDGIPSDPFEMECIPIEQFQYEANFCTPRNSSNPGDNGFTKNYVTLVTELDPFKEIPIDLELGLVTGTTIIWKSVKAFYGKADYVFGQSINGKSYGIKTITIENGVYKARCASAQFGTYLYGFGSYDSYGYPATTGFKLLNSKDSLPPDLKYVFNPCSGSVTSGSVTDMPEIDAVRTNLADVSLIGNSYNYALNSSPFEIGISATANWNLSVIDPSKDAKAFVNFIDRAGNDTTISFEYSPMVVSFSKDEDYGDFKEGGNQVIRTFSIENKSSLPILIKNLKLLKGDQHFSIELPLNWNIKDSIEPGGLRTFQVIFTPKNLNFVKRFVDSIGLEICEFRNYVQIIATGGAPEIVVEDYFFPKTSIYKKNPISALIKASNIGSAQLTISNIDSIKNMDYSCPYLYNSILPIQINPKISISFTVNFKPKKPGMTSEIITFTSDANGFSDSYCELYGTGTAPNLKTDENIDFGDCMIFNKSQMVKKAITISNDTLNFPFCEAFTITDIDGMKEISSLIDSIGSEGFYFDKKALMAKGINNRITLNPGDRISFDVFFLPSTVGNHKADLKLYLNFAGEFDTVQTIHLTGVGSSNLSVDNSKTDLSNNLKITPNPILNSSSTINFKIDKKANTTLRIVNTIGETAAIIYDGELIEGTYNNFAIPDNLMNGTYYVELISGSEHWIQKIVVIK